MDLEQRVKTPGYQNWIKGTLALIHICDAVREYTKYVFEQFKQNLPDGSHFDSGFNANWMCQNVAWSGQHWTFPSSNICNPCANLFNEVVRHHLYKDKKMGFDNCTTKEVGGSWGIAKIFMPKNCQDIETPEHTDPHALFHTILNCDLFPLSHRYVETIITARNDMMHSRTNTLTDQYTRNYFDAMNEFLSEASSGLSGSNSSVVKQTLDKAREDINELLTSALSIDIMSEKAKQAITYKKEYIIKNISDLSSTSGNKEQLQGFYTMLEDLRSETQFWDTQSWEKGNRDKLDEANRKIEKLEQDLRITQKELQLSKDETTRLEQDVSKLQETVDLVTKDTEKNKDDLSDIQRDMNKVKDQNESLQKELQKVNERVSTTNNEQETIKASLNLMSQDMATTKDQNRGLQDELNIFRDETKALNEENQRMKEDINFVKEGLNFVTEENKTINDKLDDVRREVPVTELKEENLEGDLTATKILGDQNKTTLESIGNDGITSKRNQLTDQTENIQENSPDDKPETKSIMRRIQQFWK